MTHRLSISIVLMTVISPAWAQLMSSHASGAPAQPAASADAMLQPVGKPVARVNGAVLTDRDLLREMYTIFPYARQHNGGVPKAMEADIRSGAMKMIVFEELVYQEAKRRQMTVPPERMQKAQAQFRKQFASPEVYQELIKTEFKGSKTLLNAKIERSLLIEEMMKQEIGEKSYISVAAARSFYDKNPDRFLIAESYAVQTLSIIPPANVSPEQAKEAHKKAEDALRQAKQTKSYDEFGLLAEKISEDDYRVMMGDHKAVESAKLPPPVLQAVQKMQPDQVSDLIDIGNNGYTIVRLNAHVPAGKRKFEEVKASVRDYLKKQKTEELRAAFDKRLRKNAKVEEL
jgi:hypothetical protein